MSLASLPWSSLGKDCSLYVTELVDTIHKGQSTSVILDITLRLATIQHLVNFSRKQNTPTVLHEYAMLTGFSTNVHITRCPHFLSAPAKLGYRTAPFPTEFENAVPCEIHQHSSDGISPMSEAS